MEKKQINIILTPKIRKPRTKIIKIVPHIIIQRNVVIDLD
jgi:hypothetical protein